MWRITVTALLSCILTWAVAADSIQPAPDGWSLMASLGQKAIVRIDGRRYRLSMNRPHPKGFELKSVAANEAIISYQGHDYRVEPVKGIRTDYQPAVRRSVRIPMDAYGHYSTSAQINGIFVETLIDTGATTVALNQNHAKQLGIRYSKRRSVPVQTASGMTYAYEVMLDSVRIGEVEVRKVKGMILPGNQPSKVLIGMTFLSRVNVEQKNKTMTLESKL